MILVSACLLGQKTKYNGGSNPHGILLIYKDCGRYLPVCPELLGQLTTPRPPAEIQNGTGEAVLAGEASVINKDGQDVTRAFGDGAAAVWEIAQKHKVKYAIFKESSPSCGVHDIYDGTFSGRKVKGQGVCAALLAAKGIKLYSEKDLSPDLIEKLITEDMADD